MQNIVVFILISLTFFTIQTTGFKSFPSRKYVSLQALKLETIPISLQLNPKDYIHELRKVIPEKDILRWYIAKFENGFAVIEVVREIPDDSNIAETMNGK
jgi:hypothetical protein